MSYYRLLGVVAGLILSFLSLLFLLFAMGIYLHEPGVPARGLNCALAAVPFLVSVGVVYLCFAGGTSYGRAALYTLGAETLAMVLGALVVAAFIYLRTEPRVLLEQRAPFMPTLARGEAPQLPLASEAVGIELPDGRFHPILLLQGRLPERGYNRPPLAVDVTAGPPRLKVYRGTNGRAAANHFLGEFAVTGYAQGQRSVQLMVVFDVEPDQRLFLQARDADATHNVALTLKRVALARSP
jgi:hypothetical protein